MKPQSDHAVSVRTGGIRASVLRAYNTTPKRKPYKRTILLKRNGKQTERKHYTTGTVRKVRKDRSKPRASSSTPAITTEQARKWIANPRPIVERHYATRDIINGRKLATAINRAQSGADLY